MNLENKLKEKAFSVSRTRKNTSKEEFVDNEVSTGKSDFGECIKISDVKEIIILLITEQDIDSRLDELYKAMECTDSMDNYFMNRVEKLEKMKLNH